MGDLLEDPRPDGGHLGTAFRGDDLGDEVAAERGGGLHEEPFVVDVQADAVGGEARPEALGNPRGKLPAEGGGADQDDLRVLPLRQSRHEMRVGFHAVAGQPRIVGKVDLVGAVGNVLPHNPAKGGVLGEGIVHPLLRPVAEDNPAHLGVDLPGQLPRPGEELEGHPVLKVVPVVAEYPDASLLCTHDRYLLDFRS